jgi:hypothetical protein
MDIQDTIAEFINSCPPGWSAADHGLQGFLGLNGDPAATRRAFNAYLAATGFRFNPGWPAGIDCGAGG